MFPQKEGEAQAGEGRGRARKGGEGGDSPAVSTIAWEEVGGGGEKGGSGVLEVERKAERN